MNAHLIVLVGAVEACVVLHELGHLAAARAFGFHGRPVAGLRPLRVAIRVEFPDSGPPPLADLVIALAGPAVNVALAVPFWAAGLHAEAQASAVLGLVCLVPFKRQDGRRALHAARRLATVGWRC